MESIHLTDRAVIAAQIGRAPRGLLGVPVRCSYGYPQVLRVRPVLGEEPFPTVYWLSCPHLVRAIDRLEAEGWIPRLERRMAGDARLRAAMNEAHGRYVRERWATLAAEERARLEALGRSLGLHERGIGGIADRRWLKCLHLHVAHELADGNPIGRIVRGMIPSLECPPDGVRCTALGGGASDGIEAGDR